DGLRLHGAKYTRGSLYEIAHAFRTGERPVDLVLAQASLPFAGRFSLGVTVDYVHAAAERARVVLVEAGAGVPWTGSFSTIEHENLIAVHSEPGRPRTLARTSTDRDRAIAEHVAPWIPNAATLQLGMASWIDPLVALLKSRRGLRIHSGLI